MDALLAQDAPFFLAVMRREMERSRNRVGIALRDRPLTETRRACQLVESPDYTNHLFH